MAIPNFVNLKHLKPTRSKVKKNLSVSLCIPVLDGLPHLAECLSSAIAQTEDSLEILLSDDGSSDGSLSQAKEILTLSGRNHRIIKNSNPGIANNCNNSIKHARGEYIKFLFQDDVLANNCVEKLLNATTAHPKTVLVFSKRKPDWTHHKTKSVSKSTTVARTFTRIGSGLNHTRGQGTTPRSWIQLKPRSTK